MNASQAIPRAAGIFSLVACLSCSDVIRVCAGVAIVRRTIPDTTTIKVGASTIAIAGEDYDSCGPVPPRVYDWHVSDSTVVTLVVIDSFDILIIGRRVGNAVVTPV